VNRAIGSQYCGTSGSERQTYQTVTGYFERSMAVGRNFDDSAPAAQGCGNVQIAVYVKGQALRTAQSAVETRNAAVRVDLVNAIETRCGGARNE